MSDEQQKALEKLSDRAASNQDAWLEYWKSFSDFSTWGFWVNVMFFIVPLIVLVIFLDRRKAFRIGFYGFGVHVVTAFLDAFGTTHGLWQYPYKWFPFLPNSLGLDASLIPVSYMLMYQYTIRHNKNFYLWMAALSLVFAFGIKPLMDWVDLFQRYRGLQFWHIFGVYLVLGTIPKLFTDFFGWYQSKAPAPT